MPRLFREAPLNGIWEGSGNVICLDVLRAMGREPESRGGVLPARSTAAAGADARLDALRRRAARPSSATSPTSSGARGGSSSAWRSRSRARCSSDTAIRRWPTAFCASRLGGDHGLAFGTLPSGIDCPAIIARAWPV